MGGTVEEVSRRKRRDYYLKVWCSNCTGETKVKQEENSDLTVNRLAQKREVCAPQAWAIR